jgi:hypothetical protein
MLSSMNGGGIIHGNIHGQALIVDLSIALAPAPGLMHSLPLRCGRNPVVERIGKWASEIWGKLSGKTEREQREAAEAILKEHEARACFGADEALARLTEVLGEERAKQWFATYASRKIKAVVKEALADRVLDPEEEKRISLVMQRYGNPQLDPESQEIIERARALYHAMTGPLVPVETPLLLRKGEFCVYGTKARAMEERSRTVRVNYGGPTARIKIMKGVYYSMGSLGVSRQTESYMHSFGEGVLAATNRRLLWMSPSKTISLPLQKIVMFEPYSDGVKLHKETGKPIIFSWTKDNGVGSVLIGRVLDELRDG